MIYAVKTTTGRELQVMERLNSKAKKHPELNIYAIMKAHEIRGYLFVEAETEEDVNQLVYGVTYARGVVSKPIMLDELKHLFEPVAQTIDIKEGDIVEVSSGPFKGEKAKVRRINKLKEEVVIELLEAAVPIPLTVKLDSVRVIRREE